MCDSAWRVRCTPARLNIATTITEDPIVPSPQSRCRWRSPRSGPELQISVRTIRDRIRPCSRARAARGSRDRDDFVRNSRIPKRAPRAGAGAVRSRARRARTPAPARTGEARSKPGLVLRRNLRWNPSRRGPSRHTVSSHAPGAGRGKPLSVRMTRDGAADSLVTMRTRVEGPDVRRSAVLRDDNIKTRRHAHR